jgi:hypothetical protein
MKAVLAIVAVLTTLAILGALATVSTTLPAHAQGKPGRGPTSPAGPEPKKKVDDKGYKSSLERIPDQKFDPWGKIR